MTVPHTTPASETALYAANAEAASFYADQLTRHDAPRTYLARRGLADAAAPWQLGYAPAHGHALTHHLRARGFTEQQLYAAGLTRPDRHGNPRDRFRHRLTLPIHDPDGRVIAFTTRDLTGHPDAPKYLETPTTRLYRKSETLYGLGNARHTDGNRPTLALLTEGPLDALAIWRMHHTIAHHPDSVTILPLALCGTRLTAAHLTQLRHTTPDGTQLSIALDNDPAGQRALLRTYPQLRTWPHRTYAITLPDGHDPADLLATHGPAHGPAHGLEHLAARLAPATRAALTIHLEQLYTTGHLTHPDRYADDRLHAYRAITDYLVDDPTDLPALAQAAADRLGITDTEVVRGVLEHLYPDLTDAALLPPETPPTTLAHEAGTATCHPHEPVHHRSPNALPVDANSSIARPGDFASPGNPHLRAGRHRPSPGR